tara:strand:+ start:131 stop:346 length:216 start_codon:yes stop_codon:yes gene_type:complete
MAYDPQLQEVLEKLGGPTALAKRLGIGASAVTQWHRIPPRHMFKIAAITGIPVHNLRPDLVADPESEDQAP